MNLKQTKFEDSPQSFRVEHVVEEHNLGNMRPVLYSNEDVNNMAERSQRARLITQICGGHDDGLTRDFMSSFCSTKGTDPPLYATSHKISSEPRRRPTIPTYPSLVQSLRWSPYVEVSSADNSQTTLVEDKPRFNCHCETCDVKNCPSRVSSSTNIKSGVFKNNIMTFSDRCTMTPRLNDACCGVCTPIPTTPKTSDVYVPDVAVRDTETVTQFPTFYKQCDPMPILKRYDHEQTCPYNYCSHANGHVPIGIRQEAVRDTDIGDDYCEPIKPKYFKSFFKSLKKKPVLDSPHCMPEYGRKNIYNEGISDKVVICPLGPMRVPSPINVPRHLSRTNVKSKTKCHVDSNNVIPFAHRSISRYHHSCKKSNLKPVYHNDQDSEIKHVIDSPVLVKKTFTSSPMRPYRNNNISLPRRVLTSEPDIDSFIVKKEEDDRKGGKGYKKKNKK